MPINYYIFLSIALFVIGIIGVLTRRNAIIVFMCIELMLNAANVNLVAFNYQHGQNLDGQLFSLFVIIVAVCETAVGLAIVLRVYQEYQRVVPDQIDELKD